jgi:2-phospho-L-lactate guanylyltransferase (CobY/MobA/RfbA family)
MAYNLEVIELVQLYVDPKDIPLVEHKVLMPLVAADRHSKVFFAPQVRIIAQSLFEADL